MLPPTKAWATPGDSGYDQRGFRFLGERLADPGQALAFVVGNANQPKRFTRGLSHLGTTFDKVACDSATPVVMLLSHDEADRFQREIEKLSVRALLEPCRELSAGWRVGCDPAAGSRREDTLTLADGHGSICPRDVDQRDEVQEAQVLDFEPGRLKVPDKSLTGVTQLGL